MIDSLTMPPPRLMLLAALPVPRLLQVSALLIGVLFASSANAGIVTANFGGVFADAKGLFPDNTPFSGQITYDTDTLPISVAGDAGAFPVDSFVLSILGNDFTSSPLLQVNDGASGVSFDSFSTTATGSLGPPIGTSNLFQFTFSLRDNSGSAFSSLALPESLSLSDFAQPTDTRTLGTLWTTPGLVGISGSITSLSTATATVPESATVPEPATAMSFLGVSGMAFLARRRKYAVQRD